MENNSVFVWGQLIVDLIPRYGDLKVNTGNETSGQKATLLLSPRDCVTASLAPTFMTLQMILEDQFLFKTYIHTYAGTLYHVLLSEKVLSHKSVRRPCHLCQHQALSSAKTCQQTLRGEQCQQAATAGQLDSCTVNTEPFPAAAANQISAAENLHNH